MVSYTAAGVQLHSFCYKCNDVKLHVDQKKTKLKAQTNHFYTSVNEVPQSYSIRKHFVYA